MRAEALKGHLDGLLLSTLEPGPTHGYALIEALKANSGGQFDLPTGTVYPALRRLEAAGLVQSTWSDDPGRPRRTYELTRKGRDQLQQRRKEWSDFSTAVTTVLTGGAAWNPAT